MNYNPYVAPQGPPPPGMPGMAPQGPGGAQPWAVGEVIGGAWNAVKANFVTLVFAPLVAGIIAYIPMAVCVGIGQVVNDQTVTPILFVVGELVFLVALAFFAPGIMRLALAAARGQTPTFGMVFGGGNRFLATLGAMILLILVTYAGLFACIVPGIILSLGLSQTIYFVVDQNLGPIESMKRSWAVTKNQWGAIFVLHLACGGIALLGEFACFIGLFVALPVVMVAQATLFLRLIGAAPVPGQQFAVAQGVGPAPAGFGPPPAGGFGGGGYGPPGGGAPPGGGYGPPGGGAPPGGGYGPPQGGGYGPPPGGGGYGR